MRFFYLKLGNRNFLADYWLSEQNLLGRPAIAIYFGTVRSADILNARRRFSRPELLKAGDQVLYDEIAGRGSTAQWRQVYAILDGAGSDAWFLTFAGLEVYIYRLEGEMYDLADAQMNAHDQAIEAQIQRLHLTGINARKARGFRVRDEEEIIQNIPKVIHVKECRTIHVAQLPLILSTLGGTRNTIGKPVGKSTRGFCATRFRGHF